MYVKYQQVIIEQQLLEFPTSHLGLKMDCLSWKLYQELSLLGDVDVRKKGAQSECSEIQFVTEQLHCRSHSHLFRIKAAPRRRTSFLQSYSSKLGLRAAS